jgi:hypothetical protein
MPSYDALENSASSVSTSDRFARSTRYTVPRMEGSLMLELRVPDRMSSLNMK